MSVIVETPVRSMRTAVDDGFAAFTFHEFFTSTARRKVSVSFVKGAVIVTRSFFIETHILVNHSYNTHRFKRHDHAVSHQHHINIFTIYFRPHLKLSVLVLVVLK